MTFKTGRIWSAEKMNLSFRSLKNNSVQFKLIPNSFLM